MYYGRLFVLCSVEPAAKCIVFSQWDKLLSIVSTALEHNRVRSVRPGAHGTGGKKKLQDVVQLFSADDSIRVLLLPIEKAGRGINIVAATHVMLLEPMLTPDLELQAAGMLDQDSGFVGLRRSPHFINALHERNS